MIRLMRFWTLLPAAFLAVLMGWNLAQAGVVRTSPDKIMAEAAPRFELAR